MSRLRSWISVAVVALSFVPGGARGASELLTEAHCDRFTQSNADFEAYGPTDVNVQAGNGRVTVDENDRGTITVFKYPNPSYYNQVRYFAMQRDASGRVTPQAPNQGSFAGIFYRTRTGSGFAWLRDWATTQRYSSDDLPIPSTTYRSARSIGLQVRAVDFAGPNRSPVFERQYIVTRLPGSPVTAARLIYYENFNPTATRIAYLPVTDWCVTQASDQSASYDAGTDAIVHSWSGIDAANGKPSSVAFAFGWDGEPAGHQVGGDAFDPVTLATSAPDGYAQASSGTLGGSDSAIGQVTGTLATDLAFSKRGGAMARMIIAGGPDRFSAISNLTRARAVPLITQVLAVNREWRSWLSHTLLPRSSNPRVIAVAKRGLISLRLAMDPDTGAIVASAGTQGPYGEDWIRDGAFINEVLDRNGFTAAVTSHNLFYTRVQTTITNPSPLRPPGNWPMASYADGVDGAPIPWEIDETGLGIWTLWRHASYLPATTSGEYLSRVYPTIVAAANWLAVCRDPRTGMQCTANEDDNVTPSQSLHGAETVYLGLGSALAAARAMSDTSPQVGVWRSRLDELKSAIDGLYDPSTRSWREGNAAGNAYNFEYGDGGWMLWPVAYAPVGDPRMQGEAAAVLHAMEKSFASDRGEYEAKALLGLAHAWAHPTVAQQMQLNHTLAYMASVLTTSTGMFGEAWERFGGRPRPVEDQPHVWEHCLFYLAALQIDGATAYTFERGNPSRNLAT